MPRLWLGGDVSFRVWMSLLSFVFYNRRSIRPRRPLFGLHHDMCNWLDGAVFLWVVMDRSRRCLWVCLVFVWGMAVGWVCAFVVWMRQQLGRTGAGGWMYHGTYCYSLYAWHGMTGVSLGRK